MDGTHVFDDRGMVFRTATQQDVQALQELAKRVIIANYTPFLGEEAVAGFISSGMSDQEILDGFAHCTVMLDRGEMTGYAIVKEDLLHLIMVDVPFQGKGYGTRLLNHIEEALFPTYQRIRLQTFLENAKAVRFYERRGWTVIERHLVSELHKTMLLFEKVNARTK